VPDLPKRYFFYTSQWYSSMTFQAGISMTLSTIS
jgi:hypothetical protein